MAISRNDLAPSEASLGIVGGSRLQLWGDHSFSVACATSGERKRGSTTCHVNMNVVCLLYYMLHYLARECELKTLECFLGPFLCFSFIRPFSGFVR